MTHQFLKDFQGNNMVSKPTITQVENAFFPAREITESDRFAGRKKPVEDCYYALISEGTNIAIIGNRGIGKSSLSRQVINIATGNNELLTKVGMDVEDKLDFLPIYFACGKSISTHQELLEKLLTSRDCLSDWSYDIPKARKSLEKYQPKFSVGIVSLGGEKATETATETSQPEHDVETVFTNVVSAIVEQKMAKNGLLFIIDEFDQIEDKTGFASFLKALATNAPTVKFCIVGVAHDIQELMKEHASTDRLFAGGIINLPAMKNEELKEIIRGAENSIDDFIHFDDNATDKVVSLAQGHPYMVHLIGKYALRMAYRNGGKDISQDIVDATLAGIAESGTDPVLEGRYKKAVASSSQREVVLKALAEVQVEGLEIHTADAYKKAIDSGVDNPSQFVGHLVTDDYGAEILKIRERYYRFKDSLFVAYTNARPSIFTEMS
jgi:Cdc6-like AAA superfamily ATPase